MVHADKPLVIYIEDDEDDQELCQFALEESEIDVDMRFIGDGQSAIAFIDEILADETRESWPRLVMVDLSMPAVNGWDLIKHFRAQKALRTIPLVIFTTSNSPRDMQQAYEMGANAYMVKPAGLQELTSCFNTTLRYWLEIVAQPD